MDDALKARLIGAAILVALAVLLIPELLSDRKPAELAAVTATDTKGTRTFTIELGGSAQGPAAAQPARSEASPPAPTPEATPAPAPAPTETAQQGERASDASSPPPKATPPATGPVASAKPAGEQAAEASQVAPAPKTPAPAPASPTRGGWAVQVGAFGSSETASKLAKKLQAAGYAVYVSPIARSGKSLYRVRVGPMAERPGAEALVSGLKARGLPATVVAND